MHSANAFQIIFIPLFKKLKVGRVGIAPTRLGPMGVFGFKKPAKLSELSSLQLPQRVYVSLSTSPTNSIGVAGFEPALEGF